MIPSTQIEDNNIIGANATITKKFKSGMTLVGTPAKMDSTYLGLFKIDR